MAYDEPDDLRSQQAKDADYDPDQDQDTEPSNMAPAGERPSEQFPDEASSSTAPGD